MYVEAETVGEEPQSLDLGVHGDEETPVLIPNTEVKLGSGDYTAQAGNQHGAELYKSSPKGELLSLYSP